MLFKLAKELDHLEYYDEELWTKLAETVSQKKRINNIYFFDQFFKTFTKLNTDPKNPMFKKLDKVLEILSSKHYTKDRQWRYSLEDGGRMRTF